MTGMTGVTRHITPLRSAPRLVVPRRRRASAASPLAPFDAMAVRSQLLRNGELFVVNIHYENFVLLLLGQNIFKK